MQVDVKKLIAMAAEAATLAPEHLQEAAFNRAFELLSAQSGPLTAKSGHRNAAQQAQPEEEPGKASAPAIDSLDRTAHPEIRYNNTALLNALRLLSAAKEDLGIDGLSAGTISDVLVDKFRCRVTRQAVSMALNRGGRYVNRHRESGSVVFRIMAPGEDYLKSQPKAEDHSGRVPAGPARRPSSKARPKGSSGKTGRRPATKKAEPAAQGKTGRPKERVGAWAATTTLLAEGFFGTPRTIGAIVAHMKEEQGRTYKANEVSPALLRLLRDKKLVRGKNADGQYEYRRP